MSKTMKAREAQSRSKAISESEAQSRKVGDLFVWNIINAPNEGSFYQVKTPREGYDLINVMAAEQLKRRGIFDNAFGLVELQADGELDEWEDDMGQNVDEAFEEGEG